MNERFKEIQLEALRLKNGRNFLLTRTANGKTQYLTSQRIKTEAVGDAALYHLNTACELQALVNHGRSQNECWGVELIVKKDDSVVCQPVPGSWLT